MNYTQATFKMIDGTICPEAVICNHNSKGDAIKAAKRMKKSGQYVQIWIGNEGGREEV